MVSRPLDPSVRRARSVAARAWGQVRRQFITRNRRMAAVLTLATLGIGVAAVHASEWWFSPGLMILPVLAGGLLLWPRALRILFGLVALMLAYDALYRRAGPGIIATVVVTALFADVLARTRWKLGVQGLRGDQMLIELRDRIRAQAQAARAARGLGVRVDPAGGRRFLVRRGLPGVRVRRQDPGAGAGRRVRQGRGRRHPGPAAVRRLRRPARLGAAQ